MGGRDFQGREKKKPKKEASKKTIITSSVQETRPEVEIIRKSKKIKEEE